MSLTLAQARTCADAAMESARQLSVRVGVCVVDEVGMVMQVDRMDGAQLMAADLAQAKALTSLNFQCPTPDIVGLFAQPDLDTIRRTVHFSMLTAAGGMPIWRGGACVGAVGVSGSTPEMDAQIAAMAAGMSPSPTTS